MVYVLEITQYVWTYPAHLNVYVNKVMLCSKRLVWVSVDAYLVYHAYHASHIYHDVSCVKISINIHTSCRCWYCLWFQYLVLFIRILLDGAVLSTRLWTCDCDIELLFLELSDTKVQFDYIMIIWYTVGLDWFISLYGFEYLLASWSSL